MKKSFYACTLVVCIHTSLLAQEPMITGDWTLARQDLEYSQDASTTTFQAVESEEECINFANNNTFTTPPSTSGNWTFSRKYLQIIDSTSVQPVAVNLHGNILVNAEESIDASGTNVQRETIFQVGVRTSPAALIATEIEGDWTVLSQRIGSRLNSGDIFETFDEIGHNISDATLASGGNLTGTIILNTEDPSEVGTMFTGTWSVSTNQLLFNVGGDAGSRVNISTDRDTIVYVEQSTQADGANIIKDTNMEIWLKQPNSLTETDVLGRWGGGGFSVEIEEISSGVFEFQEANFQEILLDFKTAGVVEIITLNSSNTSDIGNTDLGTWSVLNDTIIVNFESPLSLHVNAGKNFAVLLDNDSDGSTRESYTYFALVKLPAAPGHAAAAISAQRIGNQLNTSLDSQQNLYYQLERILDLTLPEENWQSIGSPILGTGNLISQQDTLLPEGKAFYRWRVVPPPAP